MKTLFYATLMAFLPFLVFGQTEAQPTLSTRYFDDYGREVAQEDASYYTVAVFDLNNRISGAYTRYYMSGKRMEEGFIGANGLEGKLLQWYENGQQKGIIHPYPWMRKDTLIYQEDRPIEAYWTEDGKAMVENGKGFFQSFDSLGRIKEQGNYENTFKQGKWEGFHEGVLMYEEYYEAGKFVSGKAFEGDQVLEYSFVSKNALPSGGVTAFYKFIGQNLNYPKEAKRHNVQGKVFAEFIIEKDGSLSDIKIARGIGAGCDQEVLRVLSLSPKWMPSIERGKIVRQKMTFPISFRLQ